MFKEVQIPQLRSSAIFGTVGGLRTIMGNHKSKLDVTVDYAPMDKEKFCLAGCPSHLPEVLKGTKYQGDARNFEEMMTDRNRPGRVGDQHSL